MEVLAWNMLALMFESSFCMTRCWIRPILWSACAPRKAELGTRPHSPGSTGSLTSRASTALGNRTDGKHEPDSTQPGSHTRQSVRSTMCRGPQIEVDSRVDHTVGAICPARLIESGSGRLTSNYKAPPPAPPRPAKIFVLHNLQSQ